MCSRGQCRLALRSPCVRRQLSAGHGVTGGLLKASASNGWTMLCIQLVNMIKGRYISGMAGSIAALGRNGA